MHKKPKPLTDTSTETDSTPIAIMLSYPTHLFYVFIEIQASTTKTSFYELMLKDVMFDIFSLLVSFI